MRKQIIKHFSKNLHLSNIFLGKNFGLNNIYLNLQKIKQYSDNLSEIDLEKLCEINTKFNSNPNSISKLESIDLLDILKRNEDLIESCIYKSEFSLELNLEEFFESLSFTQLLYALKLKFSFLQNNYLKENILELQEIIEKEINKKDQLEKNLINLYISKIKNKKELFDFLLNIQHLEETDKILTYIMFQKNIFIKMNMKEIWKILLESNLSISNSVSFCRIIYELLVNSNVPIDLVVVLQDFILSRVISPIINGFEDGIELQEINRIKSELILPLLKLTNKFTEITQDRTFSIFVSQMIPKELSNMSIFEEMVSETLTLFSNLEFKFKMPEWMNLNANIYEEIYSENKDLFYKLVYQEIFNVDIETNQDIHFLKTRSLRFLSKYSVFCSLEELEEIIINLKSLDPQIIFLMKSFIVDSLNGCISLQDIKDKLEIYIKHGIIEFTPKLKERILGILEYHCDTLQENLNEYFFNDFTCEKSMRNGITWRIIYYLIGFETFRDEFLKNVKKLNFTIQQTEYLNNNLDKLSNNELLFVHFFFDYSEVQDERIARKILKERVEKGQLNQWEIVSDKTEETINAWEMYLVADKIKWNVPKEQSIIDVNHDLFVITKNSIEKLILSKYKNANKINNLDEAMLNLSNLIFLKERYIIDHGFNEKFALIETNLLNQLLHFMIEELQLYLDYLNNKSVKFNFKGQNIEIHNKFVKYNLSQNFNFNENKLIGEDVSQFNIDIVNDYDINDSDQINHSLINQNNELSSFENLSKINPFNKEDFSNFNEKFKHLKSNVTPSLQFEKEFENKYLKDNFMLSNINSDQYNMINHNSGNFNNNVYHSIFSYASKNLGKMKFDEFIYRFSQSFNQNSSGNSIKEVSDILSSSDINYFYKLYEGYFENHPLVVVKPEINFDYIGLRYYWCFTLLNLANCYTLETNKLFLQIFELITKEPLKQMYFSNKAVNKLIQVLNLCERMRIKFSKKQQIYIKGVVESFIQKQKSFDFLSDNEMKRLIVNLKNFNIDNYELFYILQNKFMQNNFHFLKIADRQNMLFLFLNGVVRNDVKTICNSYIRSMQFDKFPFEFIKSLFVETEPENFFIDNYRKIMNYILNHINGKIYKNLMQIGIIMKLPTTIDSYDIEQTSIDVDQMMITLKVLRDHGIQMLDSQKMLNKILERQKQALLTERFKHLSIQRKNWAEDMQNSFEF